MKKITFWSLLLTFALTLSACETPQTTIRIGTNPWPGYEFLHLAEHLGYFEDAGVKVKLIELTSNGDVRRAYERNQIDVGTSTTIDLISIRAQSNRKPNVFYVCDFSNGADVILAGENIETIADIKGKRVAAEPASLDLIHLTQALKTVGLTLDDIELVLMGQLDMPAAFAAGEIDVAVTYPPNSFTILKENDAHKIFDTSMIPGIVIDVLIADPAFISANNEALKKVVEAFDRAVQYTLDNETEALKVMAQREGITPAEFKEGLEGLRIMRTSEQAVFFTEKTQLPASLNTTIEVVKASIFPEITITSSDLISTKVVNRIP